MLSFAYAYVVIAGYLLYTITSSVTGLHILSMAYMQLCLNFLTVYRHMTVTLGLPSLL